MAAAPPSREDAPIVKRKAHVLFDQARQMESRSEGLEGAIEMYLMGLSMDPDTMQGIVGLWDVALRRKVAGGRPLGFFSRLRLRRMARDDSERMLCALKVLAYDPGNSEHALAVLQWSHKLRWRNTQTWAMQLLNRNR